MSLPSLSNFQIEDFFHKRRIPVKVISKDQITAEPARSTLIVNMEDSNDPHGGSHWALAMFTKGHMIWFDSFGADMPEVVRRWMKRSGLQCYYSNQQIQSIRSDSCGFWCIYVVLELLSGRKFVDILSRFSANTDLNERKLRVFFEHLR